MATKKDETTTDVTVRETMAVGDVIDFSADAGNGFENVDSDCIAIPFLVLLQAISPQAKKQNAKYIQGAEEGDFFNTVTEELYKGSVKVVPCHFIRKFNEWAPNRGGYGGSHTPVEYARLPKEQRQDDKGKYYEANIETGNALVDTREHYVLIVKEDGSFTPAIISFSSTEMKKSKKWIAMMEAMRINNIQPPSYMFTWNITATPESNDQGDWVGTKMTLGEQVTSLALYNAAKAFNKLVREGGAKAANLNDEDLPY